MTPGLTSTQHALPLFVVRLILQAGGNHEERKDRKRKRDRESEKGTRTPIHQSPARTTPLFGNVRPGEGRAATGPFNLAAMRELRVILDQAWSGAEVGRRRR